MSPFYSFFQRLFRTSFSRSCEISSIFICTALQKAIKIHHIEWLNRSQWESPWSLFKPKSFLTWYLSVRYPWSEYKREFEKLEQLPYSNALFRDLAFSPIKPDFHLRKNPSLSKSVFHLESTHGFWGCLGDLDFTKSISLEKRDVFFCFLWPYFFIFF